MKASELPKLAYDAYRAATGGVSAISGDKLPEFEDCPEVVRKGWEAAALAVYNAGVSLPNE